MLRTVFLWISTLFVVSFLWACQPKQTALPYYNTPDFTPIFIENPTDVKSLVPHQIADFSFQNQAGKTIQRKDIEGKVHIANFIFTTCPTICPTMTQNMKAVAAAFPNSQEVSILSYSVTPWIDSVAQLKNYTEAKEITASNWQFLTGNKAEIYKLARQSYFAEEDLGFTRDSTEFLHTEHFLLIDQSLRIRGIYNGTLPFEVKQLVKDIGVLVGS